MSYNECDGTEVTRAEAIREVRKHGDETTVVQFLAECGDRPTYDAGDVLNWLGY